MTPRRLYRSLAIAEILTWTLLLIGMVLKYVTHTTDVVVRLGGGVHGFVFLAYCAVTVLLGVDRRWSPGRVLAGLGSAVVPYLTLAFERSADRAGLLHERWRLRTEEPGGLAEQVVARGLRAPLVAAAVTLVVLAVVFSGLLVAGPPTQWGQ